MGKDWSSAPRKLAGRYVCCGGWCKRAAAGAPRRQSKAPSSGEHRRNPFNVAVFGCGFVRRSPVLTRHPLRPSQPTRLSSNHVIASTILDSSSYSRARRPRPHTPRRHTHAKSPSSPLIPPGRTFTELHGIVAHHLPHFTANCNHRQDSRCVCHL